VKTVYPPVSLRILWQSCGDSSTR